MQQRKIQLLNLVLQFLLIQVVDIDINSAEQTLVLFVDRNRTDTVLPVDVRLY